ncbi:NAD-dependent epimerase/dehydratase family protein [Nibricoccus sp. IMCC34717]|uniref:NAD-dependent epimerase/dehydratase family protein n=1 Tax=Nibricoccus sp. IMCC34717 TaxID=3034021 RepID=UPI00384A6561
MDGLSSWERTPAPSIPSGINSVLVTGVAGFIGARTAAMLLESGVRVVGIDNLSTGYDPRLKQRRIAGLMQNPRFSFHMLDVTDGRGLEDLCREQAFDAVVHLAGRAGVRYSMENPHIYMSVNAQGTLNVLEAMRIAKIKKLVFASTSSLYAGHPLPFQESNPVNQPISVYAASKKAAEVMCYTFHHQFKLDVSIVRYFTVYGPAGRPDMSPFRFVRWIHDGSPIEVYGDGLQTRDFTYIDDIARGTIAALRPLGCEIINLGGGGQPRSLNEMIGIIEQLVDRKAVINRKETHSADMAETQADITKARTLLNWAPTVNLEQGIAETVAWYRRNHEWASVIRLS